MSAPTATCTSWLSRPRPVYTSGVYTSARLKTQGLFSFQYGRIEVRAQVPEAQGFWPAAWLMGNNIATVNWPACGEMDVLERINAAKIARLERRLRPWNRLHRRQGLGTVFNFPAGQTAAGWHTYGMIWSPAASPTTSTIPPSPTSPIRPSSLTGLTGAVWPFDAGQSNFIILNLAVGGDWPGSPNATTPFPSQMLVDYVRIYTN